MWKYIHIWPLRPGQACAPSTGTQRSKGPRTGCALWCLCPACPPWPCTWRAAGQLPGPPRVAGVAGAVEAWLP
eukprot:150840-Lingulodinium_polyedra.AAC.1